MVTIKNYSMPHNCYDCDLHNYHECDLTTESIEEDYCCNGDSREKHCPLREVETIPKSDYEARLKADMVAMLEELISEANELENPKYILETSELPLDVDGTTLPLETYALQCYCRGGEDVLDIIEKKINELKEKEND